MKEFLSRLTGVAVVIVVVIVINFGCCDAGKINKNTDDLKKQTDSIKTSKHIQRDYPGNGVFQKNL